jgi:hypothetical protein
MVGKLFAAVITMVAVTTIANADVFTNLRKRPCAVAGTCNMQRPDQAVASAFDTANHAVAGVLSATGKAVNDVEVTREKAINDVAATTAKALGDAATTLDKANKDTKATTKKAFYDVGKTGEKAFRDVGDAGAAMGRFVNREWLSEVDSVGREATKMREGRVVDALWEFGTAPLKNTNENAGRAVKESSLVNTVASIAATAYGGPGGAAAYAAWYTYQVTGDQNLALRVGILTGATSLAMSGVSQMPSNSADAIAKKAIVAGAVGGLAVAAAGGDKQAVQEGFLKAGGMILVQDGYKEYTGHPFDARGATKDGVCIASPPGGECSPPENWYQHDAQGNRLTEPNGDYKMNWKEVDPHVNHVGTWAKVTDSGGTYWTSERSPVMNFVGRVPGMNAMALAHDKWTVGWTSDMAIKGTIVPAIMVTYIGTGDALYGDLRKAAVAKGTTHAGPSPAVLAASPSAIKAPAITADGQLLQAVTCRKSQDTRMVYVGFRDRQNDEKSCEVVYIRKQGTKVFPWTAHSDYGYCAYHARSLATKLSASGFACLTN